MIVEFIGTTGSGKSTLAGAVAASLRARGVDTCSDYDLAFRAYRLSPALVRGALARTLAVDVLALPWGLLALACRPRLAAGVAMTLAREVGARPIALNIARNVVKRFGLHELAARRFASTVVLQDEGPVQQAHSLFAHPERASDASLIAWFGARVPLPDVVVLVEATHEERVERTLARGHQRLAVIDRPHVDRYIAHAESVFDRLAEVPRIAARVVRTDARDAEALVARILAAAGVAS